MADFLYQVWLAHKEFGLGRFLLVESCIVAILPACWLAMRLLCKTIRHVRG